MEKNYLSGLIFQKRLLTCLSLQATARKRLITVSLTVTMQAVWQDGQPGYRPVCPFR